MASSPQIATEPEIRRSFIRRYVPKFGTLGVAAAIATVVASTVLFDIVRSRRQPVVANNNSDIRAVHSENSTMALSGTRVGRDLKITWNLRAPVFSDVKIGILQIRDGNSEREIALTSKELQARQVIYTPTSDRVDASLEVFSPDRKSTRESVVFVLGPSAGSAPTPLQKPSPPREVQVRSRTERATTQPVRGFIPPATRRAAADRVVVIDPPPAPQLAHSITSAAPVPLPSVPAPRPQEPQQPAQITPQAQQPVLANTLVPRKPLRQARPELPPSVSAMLTGPVQIEVRARVDTAGRVVHAESLSSAAGLNRYLATAAVSAAKLWRFEPGSNSSDTVVLKFMFEPR